MQNLYPNTVVVAVNNFTYPVELELGEKVGLVRMMSDQPELQREVERILGPNAWDLLISYQEQVEQQLESWENPREEIKRALQMVGNFIWRNSDYYVMRLHLDEMRTNAAWQSDDFWE